MQALTSLGDWFRFWLYDWDGANVDIFLSVNRAVPDGLLWLPESLTWLGSYWSAPVVAAMLLLWSRGMSADRAARVSTALSRFVLGLALALSSVAAIKMTFAFPRPWHALGDLVFRVVGTPDSRYSLPSGHATYVAVLAAAIWPLLGRPAKAALLTFTVSVGWSRIALGAHFPADVLAGFALGWINVIAAGPLARRVAARLPVAGLER
ncbi:MAG: phosphatase PAP2 family protein [Gammaproteobacteria bacterium]|nr:phosphatase PAP2 family protein [Gammaproteobacteria bacterium]MBU0786599.1 phosphatase PAP2 family protein [Gammaproteobacteria bacterium]MBU0814330.1 phosphatase PAP2 family protein [Gammaproteobacteria bacterium]MBU1786150.1 phosphatase PAP2 family protein [Gammaproteobacteria bacterium]